jgi:glycosyltransferase involved in cell wall biosynthesis
VTVVYNAAGVLETAIRSVVDQAYSRVEYIVIDGGSTDGSVAVIERYADRIAHWVSEPDGGIYDAMNKALAVARGDWLLFLGSDDVLLAPLSSIAGRLRDPRAIYYGNVQIERSGAISGGRFSRYRMMQENICHQAIFYPRSAYAQKRYDTGCGPLADHLYNIELRGAGVPFVHLDATISRFNDGGVSSVRDARFESIKLAAIHASFGLSFYALKCARNALVRIAKGHHGAA